MLEPLTTRVKRYGIDADLPATRPLRAGPVRLVLENADLRYVSFGDTLIVLRVYLAVRDRNWDTIEPVFTTFNVTDQGDSFRAELEAEHISDDVDFAWSGIIEGNIDGTISYRMDGAPRRPFKKNRIGFCVLHPMQLAGARATIGMPAGIVESSFPERISPDQPFLDMISMSHPAGPEASATIRFEGDLFETEDQRNWTDASFKTYSTPLRLPYPVEVTPSDHITQSVTISVSGRPHVVRGERRPADVAIDFDEHRPLAPIGFGAGTTVVSGSTELEALRALKPSHLWLDLDLGDSAWRSRLSRAATNASALDTSLDVRAVADRDSERWSALANAIAEEGVNVGNIFVFPPVTEPVVFPRTDLVTNRETVMAARRAFGDRSIGIGGGSRAHFTELNRGVDVLPLDQLDAVTYPINPQVHAIDNLSMIETLAAQGVTVTDARRIAGVLPVMVGPVTLKPPYNPNATAPPAQAAPDQLPDSVDPRQLSLFGAGWTLGSIHRLAEAGASALTYYELTGWRGLVERREGLTRRNRFPSIPGGLFPIYHVFAAIASFGPADVARVTQADELVVEALALCQDDRVRVLLANLTDSERAIEIAIPGISSASFRLLDDTSYVEAANDPTYLHRAGDTLGLEERPAVVLPPFAIGCITGRR